MVLEQAALFTERSGLPNSVRDVKFQTAREDRRR